MLPIRCLTCKPLVISVRVLVSYIVAVEVLVMVGVRAALEVKQVRYVHSNVLNKA